MASKRVKKKMMQRHQNQLIQEKIERAKPFIESRDLADLSKQVKTVAQRMQTLTTLSNLEGYISDKESSLSYWRDRGAKIKYGKIKFRNSLDNMEKYHLIKRYWELVKEGHIQHDSSALEWYNDVADWSLENMSDEELNEVIAAAEDRKSKISAVDFAKMVNF